MTAPTAHVAPHDDAAEQGALASVVIDASTWAVIGALNPDVFWRETHRKIWQVMSAMHADGQPVDDLEMLHSRANSTPGLEVDLAFLIGMMRENVTALYAERYAARLRDLHARRTFIRDSGRIWTAIYDGEASSDELIEAASKLPALFESRTKSDVLSHADALDQAMAAIDAPEINAIPTPYRDLTAQLLGFEPGTLYILGARPAMGKALTVDSRVLTPTGWKRMGDLTLDESVIGVDGKPCAITGIWDQGVKPVFKVSTKDGASVKCCAEHLWHTRTKEDRSMQRPGGVRNTAQIVATLKRGSHWNHALPFVNPVEFSPVTLPIDPYLLGVYLGDGDSGWRLTNPEHDVIKRVRAIVEASGDELRSRDNLHHTICGVKTENKSFFKVEIEKLGLAKQRSWEKFIPAVYLTASLADRLALLQGLCDTDGYVTDPSASSVEFSTTSPALAEAVIEITQSLGGWATMSSRPGSYVKDGDTVVCRVNFRVILSLGPSGLVPVSSAKHLAKWRGTARISERTIVGVSEAGYEECRCISVDGPDNLYVTEGYLVTHNSAMGYGMALHAATLGHPVAFASLEMPARQLVTRALAASAGVDSHRIRHHTLSTYDRARLQKAADAQRALPISYLEATDQTGASIARDARKLRTQGKLDMLVIDYLQLVESGKASENRVQEISQLTRLLKKLAMELEIPIIVLSQLSRAVEQRQEKRPMLSDLRESGSVEQDADVVLFLYRDEYYDKKTEDQGIAEVIIAKQRSGPVGTVKLSYTAEMIRFGDLYQMAAAAD